MKIISQIKARAIPCAAAILAAFLFAGCFSPLLSKDNTETQKSGPSSTLRINVGSGSPAARTIFPANAIYSYTATLTPASGSPITQPDLVLSGTFLTIDSVSAGTYTIKITGYDSHGVKIAEGTQTGVAVSSATTVISMTLIPVMTAGGTGDLSLEINISDYSTALSPSISGCKVYLLSYPVPTGSEIPWTFTNPDYSTGILPVNVTGINSGKYLLKIVFTINGVDYLRLGDIVYIGDGLVSSAALSCPIKDLVDASCVYYVTQSGAGDGRTAASPSNLSSALSGINANTAVTPTNPAKIYLLENFIDASVASYNIVKPVILSSVIVPAPYNLQKSAVQANIPLFNIGTGGTLTLEDITIVGYASGTSSIVNVGSSGNFIMSTGSVLTGNTNSGASSGGAVTVNSGTFTMEDGLISGCSSVYGGAVYVAAGTFKMNGGQLGSLSPLLPNTSSEDGGAVYVNNGSFEMLNGTICANTAANGGAIGVSPTSIATLSGGSIYKNSAVDWGGGVFVNGGIFKMPSGSTAVINGNLAGTGGGVYSSGAQSLVLSGGTIGGTSAGDMNEASIDGGGLYLSYAASPSTVTLDGTNIQFNQAVNGGGLYVNSTAGSLITANLSGSNVTDNVASGKGGGVYVNGTLNMNESLIDNNQAIYGGGVYVITSGSFTMLASTSVVSNNAAKFVSGDGGYGGGVYIVDGSADLKQGVIGSIASGGGNSADRGGGGVFCTTTSQDPSKSSVTIEATKIMYNSSGNFTGSGVYIAGGTLHVSSLTLTSGISANSTTLPAGAGLYCNVTDEVSIDGIGELPRVVTGNFDNLGLSSTQWIQD